MRVFFFVLLLANVALFVLANWFSPTTSGEVREELNADKIKLLDPQDLPQPSSTIRLITTIVS